MKKTAVLFLLLLLLLALPLAFSGCAGDTADDPAQTMAGEAGAADAAGGEPILLRTVAGSTGGAWYAEMSALAQGLEDIMSNVRTSVSPGVVMSNLRDVSNGEADIGMSYTNSQEAAYSGLGAFEAEGALSNICHVLTMNPLYLTVMVRPDSGIENFEDLLDKHIVPGDANSIAEQYFVMVLNAYGYTYDDIAAAGGVITNASYGDGVTMVQDHNADAVCLFANHPSSNGLALQASTGVKLVNIDQKIADAIVASGPGIVTATVPEIGVYDFTAADQVLAVGSVQTIFCRDDIPDEVIYNLCLAFYTNREAISVSESRIADLTPESMFDGVVNIPIHPGAQQFYDDWKAGKIEID